MRTRITGKKAVVSEELAQIARTAFLIYVVVVIIAVMYLNSVKILDTGDAEARILANRLAYEAGGTDKDTGRVYVGTLDNSIDSKTLEKRMDFVIQRRIGGKISTGTKAVYYNEFWYNNLKPRVGYDTVQGSQAFYGHKGEVASSEVII